MELTPGEELNMSLQSSKNLYFNLFAKDKDIYSKERGKILFYFKSNVQAKIYLTKTE